MCDKCLKMWGDRQPFTRLDGWYSVVELATPHFLSLFATPLDLDGPSRAVLTMVRALLATTIPIYDLEGDTSQVVDPIVGYRLPRPCPRRCTDCQQNGRWLIFIETCAGPQRDSIWYAAQVDTYETLPQNILDDEAFEDDCDGDCVDDDSYYITRPPQDILPTHLSLVDIVRRHWGIEP